MTPKEKAKELYDKYEFVYIQNYTSKHEVKQCALIAVEMSIEQFVGVFESLRFVGQLIGNVEDSAKYKYWQEVKQEIEKL